MKQFVHLAAYHVPTSIRRTSWHVWLRGQYQSIWREDGAWAFFKAASPLGVFMEGVFFWLIGAGLLALIFAILAFEALLILRIGSEVSAKRRNQKEVLRYNGALALRVLASRRLSSMLVRSDALTLAKRAHLAIKELRVTKRLRQRSRALQISPVPSHSLQTRLTSIACALIDA